MKEDGYDPRKPWRDRRSSNPYLPIVFFVLELILYGMIIFLASQFHSHMLTLLVALGIAYFWLPSSVRRFRIVSRRQK